MKNFYAFIFICFSLGLNAQIVGTWRLADQAAALAVGPNQGSSDWWSNQAADLTTRACLFDDSIQFDANGTMTHFMDGSTWLETWQGVAEGCGAPIAPHDGTTNAPYSYVYDSGAGTLTVNGLGAHVGLAKVYNGGELTTPANAVSTITYLISFANNDNTMIADINFGPGWWRFIYERTTAISLPDPNVTFRVNMSEYTGSTANGVFLNGTINNWCGNCTPMTDLGGGIWSVTLPVPVGGVQYKFTIDGWTAFEEFAGTETCIDPVADGFANRYVEVTGDTILPLVCFNSCEACLGVGLDEIENSQVLLYPNPNNGVVSVSTLHDIQNVRIQSLNGDVVLDQSVNGKMISINTASFAKGMYVMTIDTVNGSMVRKMLVE
jgi:hypothetical protein